MNKLTLGLAALTLTAASFLAGIAAADGQSFDDALLSIQHEFDQASFSGLTGSDRKDAFATLVEHAADFSARFPDRPEAVAWNGIVLSTYAGEVSAMSAMRYAKAARTALHEAESMAPESLDGGLYASLGALYSKVPGGMMGFGDDRLAAEYFVKALAVDPENIDSNFFYGEFLLEQEDYTSAIRVLERALAAPAVEARPLFDTGRRAEIRTLLASAEQHAS
jgi:tetratricopeptide (TPR) repeat protein